MYLNRRFLIVALSFTISLVGVLSVSYSGAQAVNEAPKVVRAVIPAFPASARYTKASGSSIVTISINPAGQVESARFKEGHPLFSLISESAAKQWEFESSKENKNRQSEIEFRYILIGNDLSDDSETSAFISPSIVEVRGRSAIVKLEKKKGD